MQHDRSKYIEVDKHFIKKELDSDMICTSSVFTQGQLADILTKELNNINLERIIFKLGMENTYSPEGKYRHILGSFKFDPYCFLILHIKCILFLLLGYQSHNLRDLFP